MGLVVMEVVVIKVEEMMNGWRWVVELIGGHWLRWLHLANMVVGDDDEASLELFGCGKRGYSLEPCQALVGGKCIAKVCDVSDHVTLLTLVEIDNGENKTQMAGIILAGITTITTVRIVRGITAIRTITTAIPTSSIPTVTTASQHHAYASANIRTTYNLEVQAGQGGVVHERFCNAFNVLDPV
jgi:hypothetical protein